MALNVLIADMRVILDRGGIPLTPLVFRARSDGHTGRTGVDSKP